MSEADKKTDMRIIKSKKAIRRAFLELLQEKGYHSVTVSDIAQRAMINRKTFYFHYETKEALYNEELNDTLNIFESAHIIKGLRGGDAKHQNYIITEFLNNIKAARREYLILMNDDSNNVFSSRLKEMLGEVLIHEDEVLERTSNDHAFFKLLEDVYFSTFVRVLRWWLESGSEDPASFIDTIRMLFSSKPLEMLGLSEETLNEFGDIY